MATSKTRLIFDGRHYSACVMPDQSLVVTRKSGGGKRLVPGLHCDEWINAIETAVDAIEANAICRGLLNA